MPDAMMVSSLHQKLELGALQTVSIRLASALFSIFLTPSVNHTADISWQFPEQVGDYIVLIINISKSPNLPTLVIVYGILK